ncbi:hypothetical protein BX666DRAFT_1916460 [Dichotomocladium elegans]|nr:hypothetical protein BX666DRAFT_1916460 [Dichotomocladium elegans]
MIASIVNAGLQRRGFTSSARTMKKFLVIARDCDDPDALNRRLAVRDEHLKRVAPFVENNELLCGGAILDSHESGKMVGSMLIFDAESRQDVETILKNDVYTKGNVWKEWDIYPLIVGIGKVGK